MRLTSVVLTSWISSITSKISWIAGWPWSNHVCVCVWVCVCVCLCAIWYMGRKNKYCLEIWFWPGEVMEKSWNFFLRFLWEPWWVALYSWWRHQMETFSALLTLCAENSPVTGEFPHKGQWRRVLMFSLTWAWTNDWANNRDAGDLRRHRAHYDATVMLNITEIPWSGDATFRF